MSCLEEVYKCLQLLVGVANVYFDHLKLSVVCTDGRMYVCCSVVSNECNERWCVCFSGELGFMNCVKICMCVVNELLEFVFDSIYVDLQYDEISLTSTAGSVTLWCVCSHVVVFGLSVRLSWYPMWMRWLL